MEKKATKAQLERRINSAIVFIPKDKDYLGVYFSDKGLRIEITQDKAIISTNFHRHIFEYTTSNGVSRPYIYAQRFVQIAQLHKDEILTTEGYSYNKLLDLLKEQQDPIEYQIAWYVDLWLFNIFNPLYSIGETEGETWFTYWHYMHNIATNAIVLGEHKEPLTNKAFISQYKQLIDEFTSELDEHVIIDTKSDEEKEREMSEAFADAEAELILGTSLNDKEENNDA